MDSSSSVERPDINDMRALSYNRVTIPSDLKNTICSQILDSSDSLPLWQQGEGDDSYDDKKEDANQGNFETRRLAKVQDSSEVATPKLEKSNPMDTTAPLDQQRTAQADDLDSLNGSSTAGAAGVAKGDRPGTLRRLTTRIKKTISSNNHDQHGSKPAAAR